LPEIGRAAGEIEDSPVNGHTEIGISSNWAFDHAADAEAHHAQTDLDDSPVNGETAKGITSNWAFDHAANAQAHHPAVDPGEGHILIIPYLYDAIVSGTWLLENYPASLFGQAFISDPPAIGDEINFKAYLAAGTYTLKVLVMKYLDSAIFQIKIDGDVVATFDSYDPLEVYNHLFAQNGIVVAEGGIKTVTFRVSGKNASSVNYYVRLGGIWFYRTA